MKIELIECAIILFASFFPNNSNGDIHFANKNADKMSSGDLTNRSFIYPKALTSMNDLHIFLHMLENSIPFGFAHFNDGEASVAAEVCVSSNDVTDHGWVHCSKELSLAMSNSIRHTASNFYMGIPCLCEFDGVSIRQVMNITNISFDSLMNIDDCPSKLPVFIAKLSNSTIENRLTVATVFINGNYERSRAELIRIFKNLVHHQNKRIHVVMSEVGKASSLPFPVKSVHHITNTEAFYHDYERLRSPRFINQFDPGDIVLILAGPLGRILSSEWTLLRSDITLLEMGSFWDNDIWNRKYNAMKALVPCMSKSDVQAE